MRKLRDDKQSYDSRNTYRTGSTVRSGAYRLASPILAVSCSANVLREVVDYYIPLEVSKRAESWRGFRETFFSASTMFADSTRKYGIEFHEDIVEKGNMRKTHVIRHTFAEIYDVYIGYVLTPFYVPLSWTVSAIHDVLYNIINPLIPNETIRSDAKNVTELLRAAKLLFNCPGTEEIINLQIKWYRTKYRVPNLNGTTKDIGTLLYAKLNKPKTTENGLEKIISSAQSVGEAVKVPGECGNSILSVWAEHKFYRKTPKPVRAIKVVLDDARKVIIGEPHPRPWRRTKNAYNFIKRKASDLHKHIHN